MAQETGARVVRAEPSQVMPGVDRPVTGITNPVFEIIAIIVSVAVFVERRATVKVVPETQLALYTALSFASKAGAETITRLVYQVGVKTHRKLRVTAYKQV